MEKQSGSRESYVEDEAADDSHEEEGSGSTAPRADLFDDDAILVEPMDVVSDSGTGEPVVEASSEGLHSTMVSRDDAGEEPEARPRRRGWWQRMDP